MYTPDPHELPRVLRERPRVIAREANAVFPWTQVVQEIVWDVRVPLEEIPEEHQRQLAQVNAHLVPQIDEGIAQGIAAFSSREYIGPPASDATGLSIIQMRPLFWWLELRSRLALRDGDLAAAADDAARLVHVAACVYRGDNTLTEQMVASSVCGMGLKVALELLDADPVPDEVLVQLLRVVAELPPTRARWGRGIVVDFWEFDLQVLNSYPENGPLEALVERLLKLPQSNGGDLSDAGDAAHASLTADTERLRRETLARRKIMQYLLDGHPRPYDVRRTVQWCAELCAAEYRHCIGPWQRPARWSMWEAARSRLSSLRTWYRYRCFDVWPKCVQVNFIEDALSSDNPEYAQFGAIMAASYPGHAWLGRSESMARARRRLRRTENPVGRYLCGQHHPPSSMLTRDICLRSQTEPRIAAAVLGLKRYVQRHGRLPDKLEEVIAADLPRELVVDPYTGRLLLYWKEQALVLSAGIETSMPPWEGHPWRTALAWQMGSHFRPDQMLACNCHCEGAAR